MSTTIPTPRRMHAGAAVLALVLTLATLSGIDRLALTGSSAAVTLAQAPAAHA